MPATLTYKRRHLKVLGLVVCAVAGGIAHLSGQLPAAAQTSQAYTSDFHSFVPASPLGKKSEGNAAGALRMTMQSALKAWRNGDYETSRTLLQKSLEAGHIWAAWYLGEMYRGGLGVKRDPGKAFLHYRRIALATDLDLRNHYRVRLLADAQVKVADGYRTGIESQSIGRNPQLAYNLYMSAAAFSHPGADFGLGLIFLDGLGVRKNPERGLQWLISGARKGSTPSKLLLAHFYLKGRYVRQDRTRALMWFFLAEQTGRVGMYPNLERRLHKGFSNVSGDERTMAEDLARQWMQSNPPRGIVVPPAE